MVHVKCASNRVDQPYTAGMLSLAVVLSGRRLWPLCVRHYCQTAGWAAATAANRPADRMQRRGNWRSKTDVMNQFEAYMSRRQPEADTMAASPVLYSLVKVCGSGMMVETPETKVQLVQHMWKVMKDSGLKWEVGLYNLLLQVYLQNDFHFSPSKIMEEMKACDVLPNQGTLSYLLQAYCQQGSLAGATQVLEYMKALNHPINEHIYAALITGHSRSGDMAGMRQVMLAMEAKGLRPGAISFTALLCAHAERGDIEAIVKVTESMRLRRVFPNQATYIKVMDSLSAHGHGHLIPQVLDLVRYRQWMQSDLRDLACRCAVRGEFDSTMTILRSLDDPAHSLSSGATVTEAVLRSEGKPIKEKLAMLERLSESGYEATQHDAVMHHLLQQQQMEAAVAVARDLHSKGLPVRMHYMYPVLAWYTRKGDTKGLLETVQLMDEVGLNIRHDKIYAYCSRVMELSGAGGLDMLSEAAKAGTLPPPMTEALVENTIEKLNLEQLLQLATDVSVSTLPKLLDDVSSAVEPTTTVSDLVKFYVTINSRLKVGSSADSSLPESHQPGAPDTPESGALEPPQPESLQSSEAAQSAALSDPDLETALAGSFELPLGDQEVLESGLSERLIGDLEAVETPQTGAAELRKSNQTWLDSLQIETPGESPELSETHLLILHLQSSVRYVVQQLCKLKGQQEARLLLQQLHRKGVAAGSEAYQELLQQFGSLRTPGQFFSVLNAIKSQGLTLRPKDNAVILRMAADAGRRSTALAAFNELPDPRRFNYNDLLLAMTKAQKPTQAWKIYSQMRDKNMVPDYITYQQLMITLLLYRQWQRAHSVKEDFLAGNFSNKDRAVCNVFVIGYVNSGKLPQARDAIKQLRESGIAPLDHTYLQLAEGCARHGSPGIILEVMQEIEKREEGSKFHCSMVSALVKAFLTCHQNKRAVEVLDTFKTTPPFPEVMYQLAEVLVEKRDMESAGKVLEALEAVGEVPLTIDDMVFYDHLKAGSIEEAQQLLQKSDFRPSENWHYFSQFGSSCADCKKPERIKAAMDMMQEENKLCDGIVIATLRAFVGLKGPPRSQDLPSLRVELLRTRRTLPQELHSLLQDSKKQTAPESLQESSEAAAL